MSEIILVTGGARSGKSQYAEALASKELYDASNVVYIATAQVTDEEMADRILKHKAQRPEKWIRWERHRSFSDISLSENPFSNDDYETILLDDIGNLLMGVLFDEIPDADKCALPEFDRVEEIVIREIEMLIEFTRTQNKRLILVTNEIGLGIVPVYRLSRYYRDILGRANMFTAGLADRVVFLVSGIPLDLK